MTTLGWGTLIICVAVLALRIPDAIQGRNRTVFAILFLATLASLFRIPGYYQAIDDLLGGWDAAVLVHRYIAFAAMFLVGLRVATGLTAEQGRRWIAGPVGRWVLALNCLVLAVAFFLMGTPGPGEVVETGLSAGQHAALLGVYAAASHSYPAFVSLVLMPPLLALLRTRLALLVRAGAFLMSIGAFAAAARLPASLAPPEWAPVLSFLTHAAVLGYVLGFSAFWFSGLTAQPRPRAATGTNKQPSISRNSNGLRPSGG